MRLILQGSLTLNCSANLVVYIAGASILYEVWLSNDRTDVATGAAGLNMVVSGGASPTLYSLDKPFFRNISKTAETI